MSGAEASLALSVFLACAVEAVEAFTIVLAISQTRELVLGALGFRRRARSLAIADRAPRPGADRLPIAVLRLVVGGLLLVFGLQWLRKAILRAGGAKALHDEEAIFAAQRADAAGGPRAAEGLDRYAFAICFKAVALEGLEVVFIVLTFGANQNDVGLAALAAGAAVLVVLAAGLALRAPLARVPENTMKFAVGVLLTAFGASGERRAPAPPGPAARPSLPFLVALIALCALAAVRYVRGRWRRRSPRGRRRERPARRSLGVRRRRRLAAGARRRPPPRRDRDRRRGGSRRLVARAGPRPAASGRLDPPRSPRRVVAR